MSRLIDNVEAHFDSVLAQGLQGPIEVPEWDAKIFWKPATTMAEENKIIELTQAGKQTEALVMSLILRARDEEGKPQFSPADKQKLMRVADPKVILRVITEMNEAQEDVEQALKN